MANDRVEAVERALCVLNSFSDENSEVTLTQISENTGFYKSTVLRLISSLMRFEYLTKSENGAYRIGPAAFRLGEIYRKNFDSAEVVRPLLREISRKINESVAYYIKYEKKRICLYRVNANRAIRHEIKEGAQLPLDKGAGGRVLLAYSGAPDELSKQIRQKGWYFSLGERDPDVAALAVPVLSSKNELRGALSVSGLSSRFTEEFIETTIPYLLEKAFELGEYLLTN